MSFPGQKLVDGFVKRIHRYICHDPERLVKVNQRAIARQHPRSAEINYTQPEVIEGAHPKIPGGLNARITKNNYYERDSRRAVIQPFAVKAIGSNVALIDGAVGKSIEVSHKLPPRPGNTVSVTDNTSDYYPNYDRKVDYRLENHRPF